MAEMPEEDRVRGFLGSLGAETEHAWRERECLPAVRFWKIAFNLCAYAPGEQRHLDNCSNCRRRGQEVAALAASAGSAGKTGAASNVPAGEPAKVAADQPKNYPPRNR